MKKNKISLSWLTDLEKLERKQNIKRIKGKIEKPKKEDQNELDDLIMEACVKAYNMPLK